MEYGQSGTKSAANSQQEPSLAFFGEESKVKRKIFRVKCLINFKISARIKDWRYNFILTLIYSVYGITHEEKKKNCFRLIKH